MIEEYEQILEISRSRKKQIRSLCKRLRKMKDKQITALFGELHQQAFERIDCLLCANCCSSVGPLLNEQDVDRAAKAFGMKGRDFVTSYLRRDEDGDLVFSSLPCPFLCSDNKCLIYESRPKACREYPHTDQRYIHRYLRQTEINSRHCPAVAVMFEELLNKEP